MIIFYHDRCENLQGCQKAKLYYTYRVNQDILKFIDQGRAQTQKFVHYTNLHTFEHSKLTHWCYNQLQTIHCIKRHGRYMEFLEKHSVTTNQDCTCQENVCKDESTLPLQQEDDLLNGTTLLQQFLSHVTSSIDTSHGEGLWISGLCSTADQE